VFKPCVLLFLMCFKKVGASYVTCVMCDTISLGVLVRFSICEAVILYKKRDKRSVMQKEIAR
jgi:hypothetical protein